MKGAIWRASERQAYKPYKSRCCWCHYSHPSTICSIPLQQLVLEGRKHSYHYLFIFKGGKQTTLNNPEGDPH